MQAKSKNTPTLLIVLLLVATIGLVAGGLVVRAYVRSEQARTLLDDNSDATAPVRVALVTGRVVREQARFHGFLAAYTELTVAARVPGEIVMQWVEISDDVEANQPLFKTDSVLHEIDHEQAIAARDRAESEFDLAKANWERLEGLTDEVSASMERLEAQMRMRAAESDKRRAEAAVRRAGELLERVTVSSPIDGVVSDIFTRRGEFAQTGQPLAQVIELNRLKLLAEVEDRDVVWIEPGQSVGLTTSAMPGWQFEGTVRRVYPQAALASRKFELEIEVPNPDRRLRPGFFMNGVITQPEPSESELAGARVVVVPREAVVERFGQRFCHVIYPGDAGKDAHQAVRTLVDVLPDLSDPRVLRVVSGLMEGQRVVTKGHQHLGERADVRIEE